MQTQKSGSVVFVSSIAGYTAIEGLGVFLFFLFFYFFVHFYSSHPLLATRPSKALVFFFFVHFYSSHPLLATRPSKALVFFYFFIFLFICICLIHRWLHGHRRPWYCFFFLTCFYFPQQKSGSVAFVLSFSHYMICTLRNECIYEKKLKKKYALLFVLSLSHYMICTLAHTKKENEHIYENRK